MTMSRTKIHLISNAHLDPVWLWEWEEGAGEALSTFRQAAEFCETHKGFIFCHNEAVLYRWVEEYEPALFKRIQKLVKAGKWNVMGGWYLQPDCNMPSGESFIRQIMLGKRYFREKLGVEPKTAVNLDPFGHTRGLVQILAKSGYTAYLCCRPGDEWCKLPGDEFVWVGYDGSEILAGRASAHYCSIGGKERERLEAWLSRNPDKDLVIHLWGIGNHGGGPSRKDLEDLEKLQAERTDLEIVHSTPDAYFKELEARRASLPRRSRDINPWAVGCYTSMTRVKQGHRRLENELYSGEKMITAAWSQDLLAYPKEDLRKATEDLAFSQFHDILPGSAIPAGEEAAVREIDHGLEIMARLKAKAFFALASGQPKAAPGELPIFVYNPHPFPVRSVIEFEFEPWEPNYAKTSFWSPRLSANGQEVPCQVEKEVSNLSLEWRKRVVFETDLAPSRLNRFDCRLEPVARKPEPVIREEGGFITVQTAELVAAVNAKTGLLDRYEVGGRSILKSGAFLPLVVLDNADPWGMKVRSFRNVAGEFRLAAVEEASRFSGLAGNSLPAVRVIEDGEIRTIVEAILAFNRSMIALRYKIPKKGTELECEARVFWAEKDRMLKFSLPCELQTPRFMGQVAFGAEELPSNGNEAVAQKWLALVSEKGGAAFTVVNDCVYGADYADGELRISLLRSPAYSADTWEDKLMVAQDRFIPRQDQGERLFHVWINAGPLEERLEGIGREALARNERLYVLPFSPPGGGKRVRPGIVLEGGAVELAAFKKAEDGNDLIIRLFEPTGKARVVTLGLPAFGVRKKVRLGGFEVKTFRFSPRSKRWSEADLVERRLERK
jgi:alpha-mannosidase